MPGSSGGEPWQDPRTVATSGLRAVINVDSSAPPRLLNLVCSVIGSSDDLCACCTLRSTILRDSLCGPGFGGCLGPEYLSDFAQIQAGPKYEEEEAQGQTSLSGL